MVLPPKSLFFGLWIAACGPPSPSPASDLDQSDTSTTAEVHDAGDAVASYDSADSNDGSGEGVIGVWIGTADELQLSSQSQRVELEVTEVDYAGRVTATVFFGEPGEPPPPATDPDVPYPEGRDETSRGPVPRFRYTVSGRFDSQTSRLKATYWPFEVLFEWCLLQTPYATDGGYACVPNCILMSNEGSCELRGCETPGPIDCIIVGLCENRACECEENGCYARDVHTPLELRLRGDTLESYVENLGNVSLTRQ